MRQKRRGRKTATYRRRVRIVWRNRIILLLALVGIIWLAAGGLKNIKNRFAGITNQRGTNKVTSLQDKETDWRGAPVLDVQLLTPNPYSRPQLELSRIKGIVIHYTANPGTGAQANRNYFEGLKEGQGTYASSHFVVGLEGEVVQCIPTTEQAYASNDRNADTISIECCHPDESGKFQDSTYDSVVQLTGWLCVRFNLTSEDVIRHYDVTGKACPKYFVDHESAWEQFHVDVENKIEEIKELQK